MRLFIGSDVEDRPPWWRSPWLLALLAAGLPVDMAIGLAAGMPKLEAALVPAELPVPASTQLMIDIASFLDWAWWLVLPPLVILPVYAAWKWRDRAGPVLLVWLVLQILAFVAMCMAILAPIKTILDASEALGG